MSEWLPSISAEVTGQEWAPGPSAPTLGDAEAHVWRTNVDAVLPSEARRLESLLSAEEVREADRFVFGSDRRRFTVARAVLRTILSRYVNCEPTRIQLVRMPQGKPRLAGPLSGTLQFNVSHSAEMALYAIGRSPEVGVDVERIRPALAPELLSSRVLSIEDTRRLRALPPEARDDAAFAAWTRREAYAKARGLGLPLLDRGDTPGSDWTLQEIPLGPGWKATLAVAGMITNVRYWTVDAAVVSGR
jgi:4'-phosphopantetheinyl transferase